MKKMVHSNLNQVEMCDSVAKCISANYSVKLLKSGYKFLLLMALLVLPVLVSATLYLPAIPSNASLAKRFERSTEMAFRVKVGTTFLPSGALIAYINNEIRGAQTASVVFPPTGEMIYKILIFNDAPSGDSISFKYYDIFSEKIYEIKEKIEFVPDLVPDYANPVILTAFCKPVVKVTGMVPEDAKDNQASTLDLYWQPSPNASYYNLFLWEASAAVPVTPYMSNVSGTTARVYSLGYGKSYKWKIVTVNDCSTAESATQTFKVRQLPDLTVTNIQAPATVVSGSDFTITFKVKNAGPGSTFSAQWNDAIYLSADAAFSGDDKLLIAKSNQGQLAADSSYTQSIIVSLPIGYSGQYYLFVKTDSDNSVAEISEDNNLVKASNALSVSLKPLPDILVKNILAATANVTPGDSLQISWQVENIGNALASGGWSERITLVPVTGSRLVLEPNSNFSGSLAAAGLVSRSTKFRIPEITRFSGSAKIEVELIPSATLIEHAANLANNKALSAGSINMINVLFLTIQTSSLLESSKEQVRCVVTRSGDFTNALAIDLSASIAGQLAIPSSIIIPSNNSSFVFNLSAINNDSLDGPRDVRILLKSTGYRDALDTVRILDDEVPALTLQFDKNSVKEGETILLTVKRDFITDQSLVVNLSTNKASQWNFNPVVTIPAKQASAVVTVAVTDDQIPELNNPAIISASSAGYISGQSAATIIDNDVPQIKFEILTDTVSESAGVYATWGRISRLTATEGVTVNLTGNPSGSLYFPASVTLPKGTLESKFNIGVVDNNQVDGFRVVTLSVAVYIASCNCNTTADNGGVVQDKLVIADNDGPTLTLTVDPVSLQEGKTAAGKLTITRNTSVDQPLNVNIKFNDATEVDIQPTATIPAGQKSVEVPINTINDHIDDGDQMVTLQAETPLFSPGFCYVFVTDQNKADLSMRPLQLSLDSATVGSLMEIRGTIRNTGFLSAPSPVKINFYLSKDGVVDNYDQVLGQYETSGSIAVGDSAKFVKGVTLPNATGSYMIIAEANPGNTLTELLYTNNTSLPVPFKILPEYYATATVDKDIFMPDIPISIHGSAYKSVNQIAANVDVDIYVLSNGTRRELKAKTDAQGLFSVEFTPILTETGHFTVGACYPGQKLNVDQDAFDILGMRRDAVGNIIWETKLGQTMTGSIGIKNMSQAALHNLTTTSAKLPAGCQLTFDSIQTLPGAQIKQLNYTLKATELSPGKDYERIDLKVQSTEGVTIEFTAYYYCQALQGQLKSDPVSINTTITKGKSRLYEINVYNNGAGETGNVTISLPAVSFMSLVSPAVIQNILPSDTATVILQLTAGTDMPLNTPLSGSIAMNCVNGIGLSIPYRVEVVSEAKGGLTVDVLDEYTYFTEAKPHVKNAHVKVLHPFSGKILAEGFTDSTGVFKVDSLAEGDYRLTVEAEKHEGHQSTITIDPGRVNEQSIFLSFQAITYTWEVVPTQIQDSYQVELVMKYETNVPVPVVVMEMPTDMPPLVNNETYPFLITLTNKGLITAKDVQISLPQSDPEYEFVTNFSKMDLLAQQAIQIPVVMKRRDSPKSPNSTEASGPCEDLALTIYGWECGPDKHWGQSSHGLNFTARVCTGPPATTSTSSEGTPWFNGWFWTLVPQRGSGSYWFNPITLGPPAVGSSAVGCEPCLVSLAFNGIGCFPILGPVITNGAGILACLLGLADFDVTVLDLADCGMTGLGLVVDLAEIGCAYGLMRSAYDCYKDPPIFVKAGIHSNPYPKSTTGGTQTMPPILKQSMQDLAYGISVLEALDSLDMEIVGDWDFKSKVSLKDFTNEVEPFVKQNKFFAIADVTLIEQKMIGKDITVDEIRYFATRWNNTLGAWKQGIYSPNAQFPDIADKVRIKHFSSKIDTAQKYAVSRGYNNVLEMYNDALKVTKEQAEGGRSSVCSSVSIKIDQKLVMTREAFEGTLTIYNGNKTTAMKEVKLNLEIKDENGILSNDLFQIDTKALDILTGIDGAGELGPDQKGSATVLFIPEKGAAPTVPKSYSFGGSFSYLDPFTNVTVTKPLFPVTLDVNPSPDLYLHYFMQRDILGDDPLTPDVEPIVPAELAVMIQNNGYGTANSVRIESAQPEIVENKKGLAINFALIGSNLNGQPKQLGLTNIDFGNIAPKSAGIGQWWFTSDLLGHFVSYDAKVTHLDSRGNPDLGLISGATLHELIRSIDVYDGVDDGINDFLVNEVQDAKETPDVIYLSNGGVLDVYPASSMSASGPVSAPSFEIDLTVTPSRIGWNYQKMTDPGGGLYKVMSVTREDGKVIPLTNVWQTYVTLPDSKEPVYENMLHFTDVFKTDSPVKYKIKYAPKDQAVPQIVRIDSVPQRLVVKPVTSVTVVFNKPIDPATFTYADMTMRVQGGPDLMDASVTITQIDPVTFKVNLSPKTFADGFYALNIQTAEITDLAGTHGDFGKQASWTQFAHMPAVEEFLGLPGTNAGKPVDFILLRFNVPIDQSTLWSERFSWTKNGVSVSGPVTITSMDMEGKLFKISGLLAFMPNDGKYSLSVDLPKIVSLEGVNGGVIQTVDWDVDQTPPAVSSITLKKDGGFDAQHVTSIAINFNEPVSGFVLSSIELWKDGQRQPLSQVDLTKVSESEFVFTQFRLLTYYDGNYVLKVKLDGVSDISGNASTGTIERKWLVSRRVPKAVTGLSITPDAGFSDTDALTDNGSVFANMTVNEPNATIQLYQNDIGTRTLLAGVTNSSTGFLSLPIQFTRSGNLVLEAHCLDSLSNEVVTELKVFIDEAALQSSWKNIPLQDAAIQPDSVVLEFSDKLLDDSALKNYLKFDRNGEVLSTANLKLSKNAEKQYVIKGLSSAGNTSGSYTLAVDLTKLRKFSSGKHGVSASQAKWTIVRPNKVPFAYAGLDQTVNEGELVTLDASLSSDGDNDQLTYQWTAPDGIVLSSLSSAMPTFYAPYRTKETTYTIYLVVNDGMVNSAPVSVSVTVKDISSVGVSKTGAPGFKVYPNPTTGIFTVEIDQSQGGKSQVSVINMTGAEVLKKEVGGSSKFTVDLSNQVSGIFLIKISGNNQLQLGKIILRK